MKKSKRNRNQSKDQQVQIVPKQPIYLQPLGKCDEDCLAKLFRGTWKRIPIADRRKIVRYVSKGGSGLVVKSDDLPVSVRGATRLRGTLIVMWPIVVNWWPKRSAEDVIACQLARVFDFANQPKERNDGKCEELNENPETKERVKAIVQGWGFDPQHLEPDSSPC